MDQDFIIFTTGYVPPLHSDYEPIDLDGDESWLPLNRWDDRNTPDGKLHH